MEDRLEIWLELLGGKLDRLIEIGESLEGQVRLPSEDESKTVADAKEPAKEPAEKKLRKPSDWNPPKMKKGWLTWDEVGGWYWWEKRPEYHAVDSWTYPQNGDVFENEEIGSMMAEILGCPCCDGFDERNCIWEVGE